MNRVRSGRHYEARVAFPISRRALAPVCVILQEVIPLRFFRIGAAITVVADAASVGSDAGSIRHDATVIAAPVLTSL